MSRKPITDSTYENFIGNVSGVFKLVEKRIDGACYDHYLYPLRVITSASIEDDGKQWLHVSISHQKRIPEYEEIRRVKELFIGQDKYAIMIFPPQDLHVNLMKTCVHLWHCIDGHPLPEFSGLSSNGVRTL